MSCAARSCFPRVAAAVLAAPPFPVHQVGAGELWRRPAPPQVLDSLRIKRLGVAVGGEQRPGPGEQPERQRGVGRERPLGEPPERGIWPARLRRSVWRPRPDRAAHERPCRGHRPRRHPRLASEREGACPGRLPDGSARGCGGKVAGVMRGVKAASLALPRGSTMRPGHMIMDWLSREPHQVGHRRRVAVLAEGRVRDGVRDRAILLARERSGGPGHGSARSLSPGNTQRDATGRPVLCRLHLHAAWLIRGSSSGRADIHVTREPSGDRRPEPCPAGIRARASRADRQGRARTVGAVAPHRRGRLHAVSIASSPQVHSSGIKCQGQRAGDRHCRRTPAPASRGTP